jgi:hypothetical protein
MRLWPRAATRRRWWRALQRGWRVFWRAFRRMSPVTQLAVSAVLLLLLALAANWIFQVIRKPSELFFPVSTTLNKSPTETWRQYEPIFRKHATSVMTAPLLAAMAQVEGSGNPVARTYWRWSWRTTEPTEVYRPASSAVGMYQITDGTFAEARRYCIHDHVVVQEGAWNDWHSCWFNSLYARVIPSHAVELTSAYLDHSIATILERHRIAAASLASKQELAAVIHLCGAGAGDDFVRRGFQLLQSQHCGEHEVRAYLARIEAMKAVFDRLAAGPQDSRR